MSKIKFSHVYKKLRAVDCNDNWFIAESVLLLEVIPVQLEQLSRCFLEYDTEGKFRLPKRGDYLMLILKRVQDNGVLTTMRAATPGKLEYYRSLIGQELEVVVHER